MPLQSCSFKVFFLAILRRFLKYDKRTFIILYVLLNILCRFLHMSNLNIKFEYVYLQTTNTIHQSVVVVAVVVAKVGCYGDVVVAAVVVLNVW